MDADDLSDAARRAAADVLDADGPAAPLPDARGLADAHRKLVAALGDATADDAAELHRLDRAVVEEHCFPRLHAQERVRSALERLGRLGPVSEIVDQGPAHVAHAVDLDRVVLSRVVEGRLLAEALHWDTDADLGATTLARLRQAAVRLEYPIVESEVVRRRRPLLVVDATGDPRGRAAHGELLGWRNFVCAPVLLDGRVAGLLHGDRGPTGRRVGPLERDVLGEVAQGFAYVVERAVLYHRLRVQREELRQVASWAQARTNELTDGAVDLVVGERGPDDVPSARHAPVSEVELRGLLTRRELDVLALIVEGETNGAIAQALVVAEGTVKFHVKNILRKLRVANRAEATSRYLHLTMRPARDEGLKEPP
ncbi:MAG: GAF domain-containing protein [Solirubrobacterales bacterium]|nr:GAF domain-containing protein [Solirubrobacterales bacterium]